MKKNLIKLAILCCLPNLVLANEQKTQKVMDLGSLDNLNQCLSKYKSIRKSFHSDLVTLYDWTYKDEVLTEKLITNKCLNNEIRANSSDIYLCFNNFNQFFDSKTGEISEWNTSYSLIDVVKVPEMKNKLHLSKTKVFQFCENSFQKESYEKVKQCMVNTKTFFDDLIDTNSGSRYGTTSMFGLFRFTYNFTVSSDGIFELCNQESFRNRVKNFNTKTISCVDKKANQVTLNDELLDDNFFEKTDEINRLFNLKPDSKTLSKDYNNFSYNSREELHEKKLYKNDEGYTKAKEILTLEGHTRANLNQMIVLSMANNCQNAIPNEGINRSLQAYYQESSFTNCVKNLDNELSTGDREGLCSTFVTLKEPEPETEDYFPPKISNQLKRDTAAFPYALPIDNHVSIGKESQSSSK